MDPLQAWRNTRPTCIPDQAPPEPSPNIVAAGRATDNTAEVRIFRRPTGTYSFEIIAWTNFEDAGGNPHHVWHVFSPVVALATDDLNVAIHSALEDAHARGLKVPAIEPLAI